MANAAPTPTFRSEAAPPFLGSIWGDTGKRRSKGQGELVRIDADAREEYFAAASTREAELREMDAIIREYAPGLTPY